MTREAFHKALKDLENEVTVMADMVSKALGAAMKALKERDIATSKKVVRDDILINKMRFDIENKCVLLLATQQPMAKDLRVLASILNIIKDLERIGAHAEGKTTR